MLARLAAVALTALAAAAAASGQPVKTYPCRAALPLGPSVPAPIVLWNSCGVFRLEADGQVVRLPRRWLAHHGSGTGRRYGADLRLRNTREGRTLIVRGRRTIWQSRGTYKNEGNSLAFGPGLFAFASYRRGVYLTDLRRPERLVVRGGGLHILDFTHDGNMLVVGRGTVWVVSAKGETQRRFRYAARHGLGFDAKTGLLYLVTRDGALATARGNRLRRIGPAPRVTGMMSVAEPGLLVWQGVRSFAVTRRDGTVLASARWRARPGTSDTGLIPAADGRLFAYRLFNGRPGSRRGTASVFVLRPGQERALLILRHASGQVGCGVAVSMSWHGHQLLYGSGEGDWTLLDPGQGGASRSLTRFANRLPKHTPTETARAAWASDFAR